MIRRIENLACLFAIALVAAACNKPTDAPAPTPSLKDVFADDFLIGTALNTGQIEEKDSVSNTMIQAQFNAITAENIMKSEEIHPEWSTYNFDLADKLVAYGEKNDMYIVGHTFIWHSQLPGYVRQLKSKDSLQMFMRDHISTVGSRYAGKIDSWDVVNEALNEDGTLRNSIFLQLLGEEYLVESFRLAAQVDSTAKLYYNDYNIEQPKKRAGAIELIKKLQAAGVKIDGVGIQGHWSLNGPPVEEIEQSIIEYAALGLEVAFTELDITVIPNPWDLQGAEVSQNFEQDPKMNPYTAGLPDSVQNNLADRYEDLFKVFLKHKDKISRVTFWGVSDGQSWLNGWPIRGRTNYPLLFDRNYEPKPAFYRVVELKNQPE